MAQTEPGKLVESAFESEGELIAAFLRGSFDTGWGAVISFEPAGSPLDGAIVSIVQHQGERFSGGDLRMGRGATFADALADLTSQPWTEGLTLQQAEVENVVL